MKYLLFIILIFIIGCEKQHECKICEKVFVDLLTNEVIRTEPFEACDEPLWEIENKSIVATNEEGNTTVGVIICNKH